jgi:hypothetical protein
MILSTRAHDRATESQHDGSVGVRTIQANMHSRRPLAQSIGKNSRDLESSIACP